MVDFTVGIAHVATNLCRNPALAVDATLWQAFTGVEYSRVPGAGPAGGAVARFTKRATLDGAQNFGGSGGGQNTHAVLDPSATYTASAWVRPDRDMTLEARLNRRTSGGANLSDQAGAPTFCPANTWTRVLVTATTTATTALGGLRVSPHSSYDMPNGAYVDVTDCLITAGDASEHPEFFDGDYSFDPDFTPAWTGTAGLSTSTLTHYTIVGVTGGRQSKQWADAGVSLHVPEAEQASFVVDESPVSIRARYAGQSLAVDGVTFTAPTDGAHLIVDKTGTWVLGSGYWASPRPLTHPTPAAPTRHEILTGHRRQSLTFELLDRDGRALGLLTGVEAGGGSLSWTGNQAVKGRGNLRYVDDGQAVDWLTCRIRISATVQDVEGAGEPVTIPLGVWVPSIPAWSHDDTGKRATVSLLSRERILARQAFPETFSLSAGTNIVGAIRSIITGAGESAGALTDSDKTLAVDRVWPAGTTRLQVINDLATAGGFMSLFSDGLGQFRLVPDVRPSSRPLSWRFQGEDALYIPAFSREQDVDAIPNIFMATARGSDDESPLVSVARNDDPSSPFSTVNRGEVWADVESIDAADQGVLDAYASRRLVELSGASAFVEIDTALLPFWVNDAVWFTSNTHGIDGRFVISTMTVQLSDVGLANLRLREVVDA